MPEKDNTSSLIQTKLNRPPLPVDLVRRPRLTAWLDQRRERLLTLVSAPAGYGKSTLISCWLESVDCPTAWLSLDEWDNELGVFLMTCPPKTDPSRMRGLVEKEAKNAKRKKIHTRANHHQIA